MTLGKKIESARLSKGWDQNTLAEKVGVEPPTVSRWESDTITPRPWRLKEIAAAVGKSVEWFREFDDQHLNGKAKATSTSAEDDESTIATLTNRLSRLETKIAAIVDSPTVTASLTTGQWMVAWAKAEPWRRAIAMFFLTGDAKHFRGDFPQDLAEFFESKFAFVLLPSFENKQPPKKPKSK